MVKDDNLEPEHLRKLFIGGLDYHTTDESLKAYFEQYGEIVDVIVMKDPVTKRSRGFGFVAFSHSYMVDDAQRNRPHKIDGRTVDTKRAVPRDEINRPEAGAMVKKLFVGGIKDVSEDELRDIFSRYGDVVKVSIPLERETQKKRGFAFVEFSDSDAVDKVCLQKDITINNKRVDVKKALNRTEMARRSSASGGSRDGGWGGGRGEHWGSNQGGGGWGGQGGWGNGQGGSQGSWGGNQGGWGGNHGCGQGGWSSGPGYGDCSGGDWGGPHSDFGNNYGQNYGGGPLRGSSGNYSNSRSAPYGGGNSGYGMSGGGGYGGSGGKRF